MQGGARPPEGERPTSQEGRSFFDIKKNHAIVAWFEKG